MMNLDGYFVDIHNWDCIEILTPDRKNIVDELRVGDKSMISFIYLNNKIYFSRVGESHYSAAWDYFCRYNNLDPDNQKKYDDYEVDSICNKIINKSPCNGRFFGKYNIIQILADVNNVIGEEKIIDDICKYVGISKNVCYIVRENNDKFMEDGKLEKLKECRHFYFTEEQIKTIKDKKNCIQLNEGSRDNLLLPYLELVQKKYKGATMSQLKNFLMKKFVTEANIHSLSLGSNFYLCGVAKYYFNGDLTTNSELNIFYPNITDSFIHDVCQKLDDIILYLRNSYIDTTGTKFEQPEDFGTLTIEQLFKKYNGRVDKIKAKEKKYTEPTELKYKDTPNTIDGGKYTFDIMYSYQDCKKYNQATSPGAWCITYGEQHYNTYTRRNKSHFVIFKESGYENINRAVTKGFPLDNYGVSLLAVQQSNVDGSFVCCTTRWNHGGYGGAPNVKNADNAVSYEELKRITGINDIQFNTIFEMWKERAKKDGAKERGKTNLIQTDIIRTFKYVQMMVQNGATIRQLFENNLIDEVSSLVGEKKPLDDIKISKSVLAVKTTRNDVSKWTIMDRGVLLPEVILADSFSLLNSDQKYKTINSNFTENTVAFNTKKGDILYNLKKHSVFSIGDNMYFTAGTEIRNSGFFELYHGNTQEYVVNSNTLKPLSTPNGDVVFEIVRYHEKANVFELIYDQSAKSIYYYNITDNAFIDEIYGFTYFTILYYDQMEKNGILTLRANYGDDWCNYDSILYDVKTKTFVGSKDNKPHIFKNFKYLGDTGYVCENNEILNLKDGKKLTYPNGTIVTGETIVYEGCPLYANEIGGYYYSKEKNKYYSFIYICLEYAEKYIIFDVYTNKFFINEDGTLFFKYYSRGLVYNKEECLVQLPQTANGPYWYDFKKIELEEVDYLLKSGEKIENIFDNYIRTYSKSNNNVYYIVKLNGVENLLLEDGKDSRLISQKWFKRVYHISDDTCCVELNERNGFNYIDLNGNILFSENFYMAKNFNPKSHTAIVAKIWPTNQNIIRKDGKYVLDRWAHDIEEITNSYFGSVVFLVKFSSREKKWHYVSTSGKIFSTQELAAKDSAIEQNNTEEENNTLNEEKYYGNIVEHLLKETIDKDKSKFITDSELIVSKKLFEEISKEKLNDVIKTFNVQDELNPKIWVNDKLSSRVRLRLLDIADKFIDSLEVSWVQPEDIIMTGSLCNYNWSTYSDIDLHIIIDFKKVHQRSDFVKDYFDSKRKVWNETHNNITIFGFPVEIYVQDKNEEHVSSAIYSIEKNEWIKSPSKDKLEAFKGSKKDVVRKVMDIIKEIDKYEEDLNTEKDLEKIDIIGEKAKRLFDKIKRARKQDLKRNGELSTMNILFKTLRRCGYLEKLIKLKTDTFDKLMSIK